MAVSDRWKNFRIAERRLVSTVAALPASQRNRAADLVAKHLDGLRPVRALKNAPQRRRITFTKEPRNKPGPQGQLYYWFATWRRPGGGRQKKYLGPADEASIPPPRLVKIAYNLANLTFES